MKGKTALVTGAGSGIGRATAVAFVQKGANVVVADVNPESGTDTVKLIKEMGGEAIFTACDISQADQVEAMVDEAMARYGRLDYALNNAGIPARQAPTADVSEDDWQRVIDINLTGTWYCMKHEIAQMKKQRGGAIINTASLAGIRGREGIAAYTASKHAVVGLSKSAALDYAQVGIRVNVVCPGLISTGMTAGLTAMPELADRLTEKIPMGHMGQAEDIANAVIWLCSGRANFVTGQVIIVDGGETIT